MSFTTIASAVILSFSATNATAATTKVNGSITINDQPFEVIAAPEVSFGQLGDEVTVTSTGTSDTLYVYDGKLTVNGTSITVSGGDAALRTQKTGSQISVGSAESNYLQLTGDRIGVYADGGSKDGSSSSLTVLDAKEIHIESTQDISKNSAAIGIWAMKDAKVVVGEHAETIHIYSNKENGQKSEHVGVRAYTGSAVRLGGESTTEIEIKTSNHFGSAYAIEASSLTSQNSSVEVMGSEIRLDALAKNQAVGAYASTNGIVNLGKETSVVKIYAENTTEAGNESLAIGVWVDNSADLKMNGGQMSLSGTFIDITANGATDARAIHVGSNDLDPTQRSKLTIDADNINIGATISSSTGHASGISAMSAGEVKISGNTVIKAEQAILTRGDASIAINNDGAHTTQITGDIVFAYNADSGTGVNADVNITLAGANSFLEGQSKVTGNPPAGKEKVTEFDMTIRNGGSWRVTGDSFVNTATLSDAGSILLQEGANTFTAEDLSLDDSTIGTSHSRQTVHINKLSISENGGRFIAAASQSADGSLHSASLTTGQLAETSEAAPSMTVEYLGITSDQLTASNVEDLNAIAIDGVATTEKVAEGNLLGEWIRTTDAEGNTISENFANNTKLEGFKGVNAAALVQWRNQVNHLTKRLGDVRQNVGAIGAWARVYGGESKWGNTTSVGMTSTTIQVGADTKTGDWIFGTAFSYTSSDVDLQNGNGDGDMYDLAVYGTKLFENGAYVDFTARYGYIQNDLSAGNMNVDFDSHAFGLSAEVGHQFRFLKDAYVEPQIELAYGFASGDDVRASNSVKIDQDKFQSFVARIGFRTGFDFPEEVGTIYAHVSYSYDFLGEADGTASADARHISLDEDLGGGWVTYGIGAQFKLGQSTFAYGELERTSGGEVRNPYLFNVGCRWVF